MTAKWTKSDRTTDLPKGGPLKIYLLRQEVYTDYGSDLGCIVIAHSEEEARCIHPGGYPDPYKDNYSQLGGPCWLDLTEEQELAQGKQVDEGNWRGGWPPYCRRNLNLIQVTELGTANEHQVAGTVVLVDNLLG
jgi:hypothetical protein